MTGVVPEGLSPRLNQPFLSQFVDQRLEIGVVRGEMGRPVVDSQLQILPGVPRGHPPSEPSAFLHYDDFMTGLGQLTTGGETGYPSAHDGDLHAERFDVV